MKSGGQSVSNITACNSYEFRYDDPHGLGADLLRNTFTQSTSGSQRISDTVTVDNVEGCDSLIILHLLLAGDDSVSFDTTICKSRGIFTWNGIPYTPASDGVKEYFAQTKSDVGINATWPAYSLSKRCDSVYRIGLTTYSDALVIPEAQLECSDSYTWPRNGQTYTSANTYYHTVDSVINGVCRQPYSLDLSFGDKEYDTIRRVDCKPITWIGGTVPVALGVIDTANHTVLGGAASGCDKIYTLCYQFLDTVFIDERAECDSYTWYGTPYSSSVHYDTTSRANILSAGAPTRRGATLTTTGAQSSWDMNSACKHVDFLYLTIYPSYGTSDSVPTGAYCGYYTWSRYVSPSSAPLSRTYNYDDVLASNYTASDLKSHAWTTASRAAVGAGKLATGCDSIRNLKLTAGGNIFTKIERSLAGGISDTVFGCDSLLVGQIQSGAYHTAYIEGTDTTHVSVETFVHAENNIERILHVYDTLLGSSATGCDSIDHFIYKIVPNRYKYDTISKCDSLEYASVWYYDTTTVEKYGQRKPYCVLSNGQQCDSVFSARLLVRESQEIIETRYACDSAVFGTVGYLWVGGVRVLSNVLYTDVHDLSVVDSLKNKQNCDSVVYLDLTIKHQTVADTHVFDTAWCNSFRWNKPDGSFTDYVATSGVLRETAYFSGVLDPLSSYRDPANFQCDSTIVMRMVVYPSVVDTSTVIGCDSVVLTINNAGGVRKLYDPDTVTINWAQHLADHPQLMCDSMHTYLVTVHHGSARAIDTGACDSVTFHGFLYGHANYGVAATILDTIDGWDANGCEIHDTIKVHIFPNGYMDTVVAASCDEYHWLSPRISAPQTFYEDTVAEFRDQGASVVEWSYTDANSVTHTKHCDSVQVLALTVNHKSSGDTNAVACERFTWSRTGATYDTTNYDCSTFRMKGLPPNDPVTYTIAGGNSVGCDSTIQLNLTLNFTSRVIDNRIGECDSFLWHGRWFYKDSIMPDNKYDTNYNPVTGNLYELTDINGCDTLTRLNITMNYTKTHDYGLLTNCDSVFWAPKRWQLEEERGTTNPAFGWIKLSPGSSDSTITIRFTGSSSYKQPNGCDSLLKVKVIIWDKYVMNPDTVVGCDSLIWHGKIYRNNYAGPADSLRDTLETIHYCDSIMSLHPIIHHASRDTVRDSAYGCPSYTWSVANSRFLGGDTSVVFTYTDDEHMVQRDTLFGINSEGCDSVFTIVVKLYDTRRDSTDAKPVFNGSKNYFCDSAIWHPSSRGRRYVIRSTGRYTDTVKNAFTPDGMEGVGSCDSVYIAEFNIRDTLVYDTIFSPIACESYTLSLNGVTYTQDTDFYVSSGYKVKSSSGNSQGCDSIFHMYLNIRHGSHVVDRDTACDFATWDNTHGRWVNTPTWTHTFVHSHSAFGVEYDTLTYAYDNAEGCASVDTMYVVLYPTDTTAMVDIDTCREYQWTVRSGSNMYIDTILYASLDTAISRVLNVYGCEHFDTLSLTIHTNDTVTIDTIGCDQFRWMNGVTYYKDTMGRQTDYTGSKTPYGCDSIFTLNLHLFQTLSVDNSSSPIVNCGEYTWTIDGKKKERNGGEYAKYAVSGIYTDTAYSAASNYHCDSIVTIALDITDLNPLPDYVDTEYVCEGDFPVDWTYKQDGLDVTIHGITLPVTGDDTLVVRQWPSTTPGVCDTFASRLFIVKRNVSHVENVDTCYTYTWDATGLDYTVSGTYIQTLTAFNDCDSIVTLNITFGEVSGTKDTVRVCDTYTWNHRDLTTETFASKVYDTVVYDTTPVLGNCPYVDTLVLYRKFTIDNYDTVVDTSCNTYTWSIPALAWDTTYDVTPSVASTKHVIARTYDEGCDSTIWLRLALGFDITLIDNQGEVCDSLRWRNGNLYTYEVGGDSVTWTDPMPNRFGCDTTWRLKLKVNDSKYYDEGAKVVCDSMVWKVTDEMGDHVVDTFRLGDNGYFEHIAEWTTTSRGCNVIYYVNVTVNSSFNDTTTETRCISYTWDSYNGVTYTSSTEVRDTLSRIINGCDSIHNLFLTIDDYDVYHTDTMVCDSMLSPYNGRFYTADSVALGHFPTDTIARAGQCDSIHFYNITLHYTTYDTIDTVACDSYTWDYVPGLTVNAVYDSNIYPRSTTSSGCDSVIKIRFTVVNSTEKDSVVTHACDSVVFDFNGTHYKYDAVLPRTMIDAIYNADVNGCDSTMYLTILSLDTSSMRRDSVAEGCNPFVWHGGSYTSTVFDTITLGAINQHGCDSLVRVHVVVNNATSGDDSVEVCATSFKWVNGVRYYNSISSSDPSAPWVRGTDENGCDSVITLNLILNTPKSKDTVVDYVCDSLRWTWGNGQLYVANTTAPYPSHTVSLGPGKCDSTTYLILVLKHSTHDAVYTSACDSYTWHGQGPYLTGGVYTYDYVNAVGCASTDTLHLTINNGTDRHDTLKVCDRAVWNGRVFSAADSASSYLGVEHKYAMHFSSADPSCQHDDTLHLWLYKNKGKAIIDTVCKQYDWDRMGTTDTSLYVTGTYFETYYDNNTVPCLATDTLKLVVLNTSTRYDDVHACDAYEWTRTINDVEVYGRTVTSVPPVGYVTQSYDITMGSYTCSGAQAMRDTLNLVLGQTTTLPTSRLDTACNYFDWWNDDMTEYAGRYTASGNYSHTFTNASGCDSTVNMGLVINRGDTTGHVEVACDTFVWNMLSYTADDTIDNVFIDANGCVSIDTIYLTVNARARITIDSTVCDSLVWDFNGLTYYTSQTIVDTVPGSNGCDSIVTLNLTVNHNTSHKDVVDICDSYLWHDALYTDTGVYYVPYTNEAGCASIDTLDLTVRHNSNSRFDTTVCDSMWWHGVRYTTEGDHFYNYISDENCTSVDTLGLTVNRRVIWVDQLQACDSMMWRDSVMYTESSNMIASVHTLTPEGCDSTIWLNLTVNYSTVSTDTMKAEACDYYNWAVATGYMSDAGFVQTDLKVLTGIDSSGIHKTEFCKNAVGCDSMAVLNLSLRYKDTADAVMTGCGAATYYNIRYTNETQYDSVLTVFHTERRSYRNRCDSTTRMQIVLHPVKNQNIPERTTACDSYTWNGHTYTTSGNYVHEDTTMYGCDSIVTLILVVNHADSSNVTTDSACDRTTWLGRVLTRSGTYRDTTLTAEGCNYISTLHLSVFNRTYIALDVAACDYKVWENDQNIDTIRRSMTVWHTTYPNLYGCERVDTLHITMNHSTTVRIDSSVCDSVRWYSNENYRGAWYNTSGVYSYTYDDLNVENCDSIIEMTLTVHPSLDLDTMIQSCDSILWHGRWYSSNATAGVSFDSLYADGIQCHVVDSLHFVRIGDNVMQSWGSQFACDSFTWDRTGLTYTVSASLSDTLRNQNGCDSNIANMVLTIAYGQYDTIDTVSCVDPVEWLDSTYAVAGVYTKIDTTPENCPAVHMLVLHTGYIDTLSSKTVCERYTWNGVEYDAAGSAIYADTHTTAYGCDSNIYLPLTILKSSRSRVDTAFYGVDFYWKSHDKTFDVSGTYIDTVDFSLAMNCGRIDTLVLQLTQVQPPQIVANAAHILLMLNHYPDGEDGDRVDYEAYRWYVDGVQQQNRNGDTYNNSDWSSLDGHYYYLEVLYNNVWLRSNTIDLRHGTTGIDNVEASIDFAVYPNPVNSGRMLSIVLKADNVDINGAVVDFYDLNGRNVTHAALRGERTTLAADMPAGVYSMQVTLADGRTAIKKIIVR